jgi:peroxiredoxin
MPATLWVLSLILTPAQPPRVPYASRSATYALAPRFQRGQEIAFVGSFREESRAAGVRHQRAYRIATRFFVLESGHKGAEVAVLTLVQDRSPDLIAPGGKEVKTPASARMEKLVVGRLGKLGGVSQASLLVPVDGPPTLEVGPIIEVPSDRLKAGEAWETREPGRPAVAWQVAGRERVLERNCVKVVGLQQSDEWERGRADRGAWKRVESVWIDPSAGHAVRVERTIWQREPARREISSAGTLRLDLDSSMKKPAYLTEPSRVEIARALEFRKRALPLLPNPTATHKELVALQRRIAQYLQSYPATPYRDAVMAVKRIVDAACKGEVVTAEGEASAEPAVARVGSPAPDFLVSEITGTGTARLSRWKGKPVMMVFYHPSSGTAGELLKFAGSVHARLGRHVYVVGMSVSDDAAAVLKQQSLLRVSFPVVHAAGLRKSYAIEATPTIVVIDSNGIVRGSYVGWGHQTGDEVMVELRRWLAPR